MSQKSSMEKLRVRFAPSPTGYLHLGGARTALFNYLLARSLGGSFILRIEDTDKERSRVEFTREILESLEWLGMRWDEGPIEPDPSLHQERGDFGPYFQSLRLPFYHEEAQKLLTHGHLYKCFCTPEDLEAMRKEALNRKESPKYDGSMRYSEEKGLMVPLNRKESPKYDGRCKALSPQQMAEKEEAGLPFVLRFKIPPGRTSFEDLIRGPISFENTVLDDFIAIRSDGMPTYNFAVAVDDTLMAITHVIRGEDHIPNTPRQIQLFKALGYAVPQYGHLPLILGPDGSRLSKRHGATSVLHYRQEGYLPEAMVNFLALLGWSPKDDRELFSMDELISLFSLSAVGKTSGIFNAHKLLWMNGQHIRMLSPEQLLEKIDPLLREKGIIQRDREKAAPSSLPAPFDKMPPSLLQRMQDRTWRLRLLEATHTRLASLNQILDYLTLFCEVDGYEAEGVKKHWHKEGVAELLALLKEALEHAEPFEAESIEKACHPLLAHLDIKLAKLIHPARLALTGKTVGPGFFDTMELLGKEESIKRLQKAIEYIRAM